MISTSSHRQNANKNVFGLSNASILLLIFGIVILSSIPSAHAFGAGNIPSFAYMEGKAFRHGDIEDILAELISKAGSGILSRSSKFNGLAIKQVYFGNWNCDYSQAMDVAGLEKLSKQTIINICMVLGFLAHGYATKEFQVTEERLGAYLPVTHIDNPKGYADGKDARHIDPRLRGPVDPRELEIDPRSGMKNYIANETGNWDTSSALLRRQLKRCIDIGRRARSSGNSDELYEAYRLLGQSLHTLEDFPAHSNWCEIALYKLGHREVFQHVGSNVKVRTPTGEMVAPIVTGTFGSSDFIHSLLGEAQDHLSEASVSDLAKSVDSAKSRSRGGGTDPIQDLLSLISNIPGGSGDGNVSRDAETLNRGPDRDPNQMSPEEMYKNLWRILEFRDRIMKNISNTIEKIPGLNALVEKITNSLNVFIFTLLEPYVKPLMQQAMGGLHTTSTAVVNKEDQYEVWSNPNASDPTHSLLSKDHFGLILNEPAGNIAIIMVRWAVNHIVGAWDDNSKDAEQVADACLAPLFHPYWYNPQAQVQREMMEFIDGWARNHPQEIRRLDSQNVRNHTNTRSGKAEPHSHGGDGPSLSSFSGGSQSQAAQSFMPSSHHTSHVQNHANYGVHHGQSNNSSSHGAYGDGSDLPKPNQQDTGFGTSLASMAQSYVGGKLGGSGGGGGGVGGMFSQASSLLTRDVDGNPVDPDQDQDRRHETHQSAPQHHAPPRPHGSGSHESYGREPESNSYGGNRFDQDQDQGGFPGMPDERRYASGGQEHNSSMYPPANDGGWQQGGPPPMPNPQFGGYPGSNSEQGGGYPGQGYPQQQGYPNQGYPNQGYPNQGYPGNQQGGYGGSGY